MASRKTNPCILKGDEVDPVWTCLPFQCSHTFNCGPNIRLVCEEVLYVSDRATKSHYQLKHPNNEGKFVLPRTLSAP